MITKFFRNMIYKQNLIIKNLGKMAKKKFFSSLSARKLRCPSSAQLGTFIARLGSSWKIPARAHHYKIPYNSEWFWSHCDFYYCWKPTTTVLLLFVVVSNTADTVTRQEVFRHDPLIPIEGYCCAPSSTLENTVNNHSNLRFKKENKFFVA